MKKYSLSLFVLTAVLAACPGFPADRATTVAVLNGRAVQDLFVAKCQNADDGTAAWRSLAAVSWSAGERVFMRGYVADVSSRLFARTWKVVVTVGRAGGQAVNVTFNMRAGQAEAVKSLRPGQDIAASGTLSLLPDFQGAPVVDDASVVPTATYEKLLAEAKADEDAVLGDCLVPSVPLADLPAGDRAELADMARCAATAYPDTELPLGYRAMTREEWRRSTAKLGYADAVYSEDGFFILGNGLRGRFLVHRVRSRVVVAWSGCDLLDGRSGLNGGPDLMACFKHLFLGETAVQFNQAADVTAGVLEAFGDSEVWVVGHSLGGSLTTFSALRISDPDGRLKGATFNGLGLSSAVVKAIPVDRRDAGARRLRNVCGTGDPLCNGQQLLSWTKLAPRLFGRSYFVRTPAFAPAAEGEREALPEQLMRTHGIDRLARQIEAEVPLSGGISTWMWAALLVGGLLVVAVAILLIRRLRG